jgi:HEAT repeat protein
MQAEQLDPRLLLNIAIQPAYSAINALLTMRKAIGSCSDHGTLTALAAAIPPRLLGVSGEVAVMVHEIALALAAHHPRIPDDIAELEPALRVAWYRLAIIVSPDRGLTGISDAELLRIVTKWDFAQLTTAQPLLFRMAHATDPRLRMLALTLLPTLVAQLLINGRDAVPLVMQLAADKEVTIRAAAIGTLPQHWLADLSPGQRRQRELIIESAIPSSDWPIAQAAITAARDVGLRHVLTAHLEQSTSAPTVSALMVALGHIAQAEDVTTVVSIAQQEPICFGAALQSFLGQAHRHGIFVQDDHVAAMLTQYDCHQDWSAAEFVRLTYIARTLLLEQLSSLDVNDKRWIRRVNILALSTAPGATQLLALVLTSTDDVQIASAAIAAAGRTLDFFDEKSLLRWLPQIPHTVLTVLRCKGGPASISTLRALVRDPLTTSDRRADALDSLWSIDPNRAALQRELTMDVGPYESGLFRLPVQGIATFADTLAAHQWQDAKDREIDLDTQLKIYCESGDITFLAQVRDVFREMYRGYVRSALEGNFAIKRQELPDLEQRIFRYGRHLVNSGRSVRPWTSDQPETGRDLVLRFICEWLAENPSDAIKVALLESAARHEPTGNHLRILSTYWRRGHPSVRRAALEILVNTGNHARGLELSLAKLAAETTEPRLQTQALAAMRNLQTMWAEPIDSVEVQSVSTMAVKLEAADALDVIGNASSIPSLVYWLANHDNDGFRSRLKKALRHCAGPAYAVVLLYALQKNSTEENNPRTTRLLHDALSGQLSLAMILRLARSSEPHHQRLVAACLDNEVTLADASCQKLAEALHRAQMLPTPKTGDPALQLRLQGFSPAAARLFVAHCVANRSHIQESDLAVIRNQFASWVTWLATDPFADALELLLQVADKSHHEQFESLLDIVQRDAAAVEPIEIVQFMQRCIAGAAMSAVVMRSISIIRNLAQSALLGGVKRYQLLGQLGAFRTVADIKLCLTGCKVSAAVVSESTALLHDVLQVPTFREALTEDMKTLHDKISNWHRTADVGAPWLIAAMAQRPLGLPIIAAPEQPKRKRDHMLRSMENLQALQSLLEDPDKRQEAADLLLTWADAAPAWPLILSAYMNNRIDINLTDHPSVVETLTQWTYASPKQPIARQLILAALLTEHQRSSVVPQWLAARFRGDRDADALVRAIDQSKLWSFIVERARQGHFDAVELVPNCRLRRDLVALAQQQSVDLRHLLVDVSDTSTVRPDDRQDPKDPLADKTVSELVEIAHQLTNKTAANIGLSVRAVHALALHGEVSLDPLTALTLDPRPAVRSAALRALRFVASKEHMMEVTMRVLDIETRSDVIVSLLSSLGHGRHPPTLPALLNRVTDADNKIRDAAHSALQSWGSSALPSIHQHARRARPDRRAIFEALIATMQ